MTTEPTSLETVLTKIVFIFLFLILLGLPVTLLMVNAYVQKFQAIEEVRAASISESEIPGDICSLVVVECEAEHSPVAPGRIIPREPDPDPGVAEPEPTKQGVRSVSAYTSNPGETDGSPEIGASGENLWTLYQAGDMTCAANGVAFGTVLEIEGYGGCTVRDRMSTRYHKGEVDIYFGYDLAAARTWGRRNVLVTVID